MELCGRSSSDAIMLKQKLNDISCLKHYLSNGTSQDIPSDIYKLLTQEVSSVYDKIPKSRIPPLVTELCTETFFSQKKYRLRVIHWLYHILKHDAVTVMRFHSVQTALANFFSSISTCDRSLANRFSGAQSAILSVTCPMDKPNLKHNNVSKKKLPVAIVKRPSSSTVKSKIKLKKSRRRLVSKKVSNSKDKSIPAVQNSLGFSSDVESHSETNFKSEMNEDSDSDYTDEDTLVRRSLCRSERSKAIKVDLDDNST